MGVCRPLAKNDQKGNVLRSVKIKIVKLFERLGRKLEF